MEFILFGDREEGFYIHERHFKFKDFFCFSCVRVRVTPTQGTEAAGRWTWWEETK